MHCDSETPDGHRYGYYSKVCVLADLPDALEEMAWMIRDLPKHHLWRAEPYLETEEMYSGYSKVYRMGFRWYLPAADAHAVKPNLWTLTSEVKDGEL